MATQAGPSIGEQPGPRHRQAAVDRGRTRSGRRPDDPGSNMRSSSTRSVHEDSLPDEGLGRSAPLADSDSPATLPALSSKDAPGGDGDTGRSAPELDFHLDGVDNRERAL